MLTGVLRVMILYPIVVFGIRLMGKRQIGELQPTELVVTMLISNVATLPLEDQNLPLLTGIIPMLLLICFEVLLSWGVLKSRRLRHLVSGTPQIIIRAGEPDIQVMENLRFSLEDLMTALRGQGIFDLSTVQLALVETNGQVSVYQKADARPATCGDLQIQVQNDDPPEVVIADGCVNAEGLRAVGFTPAKLRHLLRQKHLTEAEVFLLTADATGVCSLITKEKNSEKS